MDDALKTLVYLHEIQERRVLLKNLERRLIIELTEKEE